MQLIAKLLALCFVNFTWTAWETQESNKCYQCTYRAGVQTPMSAAPQV